MNNPYDMLEYSVVKIKNKGYIGYVKAGLGTPLILLHGNSGTVRDWPYQFIYSLTSMFTVYLVDNRGIGASMSTNPESMLGFAIDIKDFIEELRLQKCIVLGFSMGGYIAQELMKSYSNLLSGVILMSTSPDITYITQSEIAHGIDVDMNMRKINFYKIFFSEIYTPELEFHIKENKLKINNYNTVNQKTSKLHNMIISNWRGLSNYELRQLQLPVLILRAKNDLLIDNLDAGIVLQFNIPNSKLVDYETGGHFMLHRNDISVATDIKNWSIVI